MCTTSCNIFNSNGGNNSDDELPPEVKEIVPDDLLATVEDSLGVSVNRGSSPPNIESLLAGTQKAKPPEGVTVIMEPFELVETVVPDDDEDQLFYDMYVRMGNQNTDNEEIDISMRHRQQSVSTGLGGYITGEDSSFTIFAEQESEREGETIRSVRVFSGIVTEDGIDNPQLALMMKENAGFDDIIPNGTGRSFDDGDGLAEIDEWPEGDASQSEPSELILLERLPEK
ncbi:hypothetical protein [Gracilimonas sp.]|uniref:hypothetical protein n=1 Tax=Gracilimonas sp. TaxID=1974203 RepID=UPI0032EC8BCD